MQRLLRWVIIQAVLAILVMLTPNDAHAKRQFCVSIRYWWYDANIGEDYQTSTTGGGQWADRIWLVLKRDGSEVWSGYANSGATGWSCTPALDAPAGQYRLDTTTGFEPKPGTVVFIWLDSQETWYWYTKDFGQLSSSIGGGTTMHTMNIGYQYSTSWYTTNVGAFVSRLGRNLDYGLTPGTIGVHAYSSAGSIYDPVMNRIGLGFDSQYGFHNKSKWTIAHEFGHAIDDFGVGNYPGATSYGDSATQATCKCGYISAPDDLHCLQSRENVAAAISEGWGHFLGTLVYNNPSQSSSYFGYYKKSLDFSNPSLLPINPPRGVSVVPSTPYRWAETQNCDASEKGVEVDWMGFWYKVNTQGTNAYSFANIRNVYSSMCGGLCSVNQSSDSPTWVKLRDAAAAVFPGAKGLYFESTGVAYGVDH